MKQILIQYRIFQHIIYEIQPPLGCLHMKQFMKKQQILTQGNHQQSNENFKASIFELLFLFLIGKTDK